jgi:sialic acid synthase SpsE
MSAFELGRDGVFVIAEAGSNWRMGTAKRDLAMAKALIDVAVESGADAVKFQTYRPESVYVANAGTSRYLAEAGLDEDILSIFKDLSMPYEMLPALAGYCNERDIRFMSTPFSPSDFAAVDPHVTIHKIASYEISHLRLIELAARSGKPLVLSTGGATLEDVGWAVDTFRQNGGSQLALLQCTARYPAPLSALNLRVIPSLATAFGVIPGFSDHSRNPVVAPVVAVALGARVIEKHYTLDNRLPGPDHSFALNPAQLCQMVAAIRAAEESLGSGVKEIHPEEEELRAYAQRSLQATRPIEPGDTLKEDVNVGILRAGQQRHGAHPRHILAMEGSRATRQIPAGDGIWPPDWE